MHTVRRRGGRLAALTAAILIVVAACGGSPATNAPSSGSGNAGTPKQGGKITAAIEGEPTSVDPAFDYDFVSGLATSSITEPLLIFCKQDTSLCPNLAESWTVSPDGLTYTLKIRQGVKFHDGTPMTVDDVVYSLNRIRDTKLGSYVGWMVTKVSRRQGDGRLDRRHHAVRARRAVRVRARFDRGARRQQGVRREERRQVRQARGGLDRHRSVQVRRVEDGRLPAPRPQRRLLEQGQRRPLPRRDHDQDPARAHDARRGPPDGRDRLRHQQRPVRPVRDGPGDQHRQPAVRALVLRRVADLQHAGSRRSTTSRSARR